MGTVELPLWLLILILGFASVTFASHFLFPSVRWFVRRRMERLVARLNSRLRRPIEPFKLLERHDLIQQLAYDSEVLEAVVAHARDEGLPRNVAFEKARRYAREIVPAFSARTYFGFAVRFARWLSRLLYQVDLSPRDEAALGRIPREATVVFVINHRSNMDYVLVTWLAARQMALSYAVGEWARVWPLSGLVRATGAYFIRRRDLNPLYRKVLERYVRTATQEGVTQAIFPEGRLSLDGRVAPARLGLLSYLLSAQRAGSRPVVFVPVGLNYDRVPEDRLLVRAAQTGVRRFRAGPGSLLRFIAGLFWRKLRGRWHGFGRAAVRFGAPVALEDLLAASPGLTPEVLGARLMEDVARAVPVLPVPLLAAALGPAPLTRAEIGGEVTSLLARLRAAEVPLALPDGDISAMIDTALAHLLHRGLLRERGGRYAAAEPALLAFYAASVWQHLEAAPRAEIR